MHSVALHTRVSEPTTKICMKIQTHTSLSAAKMQPRHHSFFQQGKFYADIRGGSLERGRQMRVGWSASRFSLLSPAISSEPSHLRPHLFAELRMQPRERSFWQYKVYADIRGGSLERGRQMRVGSQKMTIFGSFGHCLPNILHTWPHDSFQVIRLSRPWAYFKVIGLFHIKFLKNGV